jgi:hypothetical protein
MPARGQAGACPLHGPPLPHVLVPAGPGGSAFEQHCTVVVLAQTDGTPAGGRVRCLVLRGRDARFHLKIVAGRGTRGVLGGSAFNARCWLGRPAHVFRCLELFDGPAWPVAWPQHAYASAPVAFSRFELYACWAGVGSWAACSIQQGQIDGGGAVCAAGEGAAVGDGGGDSGNEAAWGEQCRESFEEAGEGVW